MTLSESERALAKIIGQRSGYSEPRLKLGVRAAAIAMDRWGRDLEHGVGEQQYAAFADVVDETVADVLDHYADEDAEVEGVDGLVFEGRVVTEDVLAETVGLVVDELEAATEISRDEAGPMIELVEGGDAA